MGNHVHSLRFFYLPAIRQFRCAVCSSGEASSMKPMAIFGSKAETGLDPGVFKVMTQRIITTSEGDVRLGTVVRRMANAAMACEGDRTFKGMPARIQPF